MVAIWSHQLQGVVKFAISDALGIHSAGQPELAQRWERERDQGKRLQVRGHIDLDRLELDVTKALRDYLEREGVEIVEVGLDDA